MKTQKTAKPGKTGPGVPAFSDPKKNAFLIAGVYLLLGGLWVLCSDWLAEAVAGGSETLLTLEVVKGWAYVLVTSALLFVLIVRALRRERSAGERARELNRELEKSNMLLAALLEGSPEISVFALDTRYRYLFFNRRHRQIMREVCGRKIEPGMELPALLGGTAQWAGARERFDRALAGEAFSDDEAEETRAGGRRYWSLYFLPIRPDGGRVAGVTCFQLDVTSRRLAEEESRYLSCHDKLTGLYNRHFFETAVRRLDGPGHCPFSVVLGDVNGLKLVNDAFGHGAGDELLRLAAEAIASVCRPGDILARWGGDEFIVLLPGTGAAPAQELAARLTERCASLQVRALRMDVSFGAATKQQEWEAIADVIRVAEDAMYRQKMTESNSMRSRTVDAIMRTLHEKNPREAEHSVRVGDVCRRIGRALDLTDAQVNTLYLVGYLHDIGKIALGEEVLNKPGRLTEAEFAAVRRHPEIGWRILRSSDEVEEIAGAILAHHERWDGMGYPNGLRGSKIPVYARIVAVADSYDAMTGVRTYRRRVSPRQAAEEIARCAGGQFDPRIARAFVEKVFPSLAEPGGPADGE